MGRRRTRHLEEEDFHEDSDSEEAGLSEDEDDDFDDTQSDGVEEDKIEQFDDDVLFSALKKFTCTALRSILKEGGGTAGRRRKKDVVGDVGEVGGSQKVAKSVTRCNVTYFSEVLSRLDDRKCELIDRYGFGSLLAFDKCVVPLPFAQWIADHVHVRTSDIVVNNKSIPFSPESIHHVLGVPIGGRRIDRKQSSIAKTEFLKSSGLSTVPNVKHFGDELVSNRVSDGAVVRDFMIVALCTFLCPNSSIYPSGEYLLPLADWKTAKEWDWAEFIHYWFLKHVNKYQKRKLAGKRSSICLGGCLYFLCVLLGFLGIRSTCYSTKFASYSSLEANMIKDFASLDRKKSGSHIYGSRPIKEIQSTCYFTNSGASTSRGVRNASGAGINISPGVRAGGSSADVEGFKKLLSASVDNIFDEEHVSSSAESVSANVGSIIVDVVKYFYHISLQQGGVDMKENGAAAPTENLSAGNDHVHNGSASFGHSGLHSAAENLFDNVGVDNIDVGDGQYNDYHGNSGPSLPSDCNLKKNVQLDQRDCLSEACGSDTLILSSHDSDCYDEVGSDCAADGMTVPDETIRVKEVNVVGSQQSADSVAARTRSRRASLGQSPLCPVDNPEAIKRMNKKRKLGGGGTAASPLAVDDIVFVESTPTENLDGECTPISPVESIRTKNVEHEKHMSSSCDHGDGDYGVSKLHEHTSKSDKNGMKVDTVAEASPSLNYLLSSKNCDSGSEHIISGRARASEILRSFRNKTSSNDTSKAMHSLSKSVWKENMTFEEKMTVWEDYGPSFRLLEELDDNGNYIPDPKKRRAVGLPCDGKKIYKDSGLDALSNSYDSICKSGGIEDRSDVIGQHAEVAFDLACINSDVGIGDIGLQEKSAAKPAVDRIDDQRGIVEDYVIVGQNVRKSSTSCSISVDGKRKAKGDDNSASSNRNSTSTNDSIYEPLPLAIQYHSGEIVSIDLDPVTPNEVSKTSSASMCAPGDTLYDDQKKKMRRVYDPDFEMHSTSAGKHPRLKLRKRRIIKENSYYHDFKTNECKVMWPVNTEHHLCYETAVYYSEHKRYLKETVIDYNCGFTVNFGTFGESLTRRNWVHPFVMNAFCFKLFHERPPKKSNEHFFFSTVGDYLLEKWDDEKDRAEKRDKVFYNFRRANSLSSLYQAVNLFFPILHESHWSLFVVALRDGYFCFLDPLYDEDDVYQKKLRAQLIPNFVKAWDEALDESYPFDEFVIHYPKIPKQNIQDRYYCGNDSGILVMKYIELWNPYDNMLTKFTANHVSNMRLLYVSDMVDEKSAAASH
ncbi:hypothetical protein ACP70R_018397 [Stipagrostis hirtigluma subsp. patula]